MRIDRLCLFAPLALLTAVSGGVLFAAGGDADGNGSASETETKPHTKSPTKSPTKKSEQQETADSAAELTFERDVRPILKAHCFQCHGERGRREGNLDLRLRRFMVSGGDSGAAISPGKPGASYLLDRVRNKEMPPGESAHLSARDISVIRRWIAAGAPTARPEPKTLGKGLRITKEERSFWSFRPIRRPPVPDVNNIDNRKRVRTPIDAFILAQLEEQGLSFAPDADRQTLIRRAYLDLLGLPPSPDEVDAFLADDRPDAYKRLIDRLLDSPRYGERWGRHWLDVAGYADSEGYNEADTVRPDAFRYRDYVIRSFNADKPFDRFIVEQLAGDELIKPPYRNLSPQEVEQLTATGFLRMAPDGTGSRNPDRAAARNAVVSETLSIVSSSLLGLTVGCAKCHDHRFDPILQDDYYRLRAVFEPALDWKDWREPRRRRISLLTDTERKQVKQLEAEAKAVEAELKPKLEEFRTWVFKKELEQVPEDIRDKARAAGLAWQKNRNGLSPEQKKLLDKYPSLKVPLSANRLNLFLGKYGRADELKKVRQDNAKRAAAIRARKPEQRYVRALTEVPGDVPETHLFHRGDYKNPGDVVPPGDLRVLSEQPRDFPLNNPELPTTGRRLALARRLTDGTHPLVPRVLVNRFWMHHFGRGIVNTPGDFGTQGEKPTHPELLDWLSSEFLAGGWRLKRLHKLIMTSTVYRQASVRGRRGNRLDYANRLYWHMPVRRLDAEALRDSVLAVSGTLSPRRYGPPVPVERDSTSQAVVGGETSLPDREKFRRSVYVQRRRSMPADLLRTFDSPEMDPNCEYRQTSTVAPQSLLLMNNAFIIEQASDFARRVRREAGDDPAAQVRRAWKLAYASEPAPEEVEELVGYLQEQTQLVRGRNKMVRGRNKNASAARQRALASLCQVLFASNRFLYVE